jgi:hypothetical protein
VAFTILFNGRVIIGAVLSTTVTVKVQPAVLPSTSVAAHALVFFGTNILRH